MTIREQKAAHLAELAETVARTRTAAQEAATTSSLAEQAWREACDVWDSAELSYKEAKEALLTAADRCLDELPSPPNTPNAGGTP